MNDLVQRFNVGWFPWGGSYYITRGINPRFPAICFKSRSLFDDKQRPMSVSFEKVILCSVPFQAPVEITNNQCKGVSKTGERP